ncbi:MAG: HAD-IA family hydrolase [Salinisphaera sp.]|jgi:sugar-phosphatase|nr:HAD-IA family hydrolase [Salinisphaera sp.]
MSSHRDPKRAFDALLFDMDGTVLTSIMATERVWAQWARRRGLDVDAFLPTIHGMRAIDTIRRLDLPGVDPEIEARIVAEAEITDVEGIEAIPGAAEFLDALPRDRWAIVTSAPHALAQRRIAAAGLPLPDVLIAAEDVARGKPAPDGFRLGADRLGVAIDHCLIFEDAPAGIQAAEAAGASLIVVTTAHPIPIETSHPRIDDYRQLTARIAETGGLYVSFA